MLRSALLDALALVSPVECAGCRAPDRAVCDSCLEALDVPASRFTIDSGVPAWAGLSYVDEVRSLILAFKELDRTDVARSLARPFARALDVARGEAGECSLVAVPSSPAGARRRGYDPVALLARRAGQRVERGLVHRESRAQQKSLGVDDRRDNRLGQFGARSGIQGSRVLIVDDVATTGSTLDEAVRAAKEGGATVCGAVVLAHTPRLFAARTVLSDLS